MPEKAFCRTSELEIPYCVPAEGDSLPPIWRTSLPRKRKVYPYMLQELTGSEFKNTVFQCVELENDFLKLTFLPELGGRLISMFDKTHNHELLFRNPVLKPVMAGLTGAWCGIGMEFNFPGSHSVTSDRPVSCRTTEKQDGSATVTICDQEMVSGMRWQVDVTLRKDSDAVFVSSRCSNRTALPHSGYWWTNAKVPAYSDTELVFPEAGGTGVIHPPVDISRITELHLPMVNNTDISHYRDVYFQLPLFFRNLRRSSFGVYHREKGFGLLHCASSGELPGRKIWTLGTGDDGKVTNENLTLDGAGNIEIQAGPLPVQTDFLRLNPGETRSWSEAWLPVVDMLKTHQASNSDFSVSGDGCGKMRIQCHSSHSPVQFRSGEKRVDFTPEPGKMIEVSGDCTNWRITDPEGWTLLESDPATVHKSELQENTEKIDLHTAEAEYLQGLYLEEDGRGLAAVEHYQTALKIDAFFSPALAALGARELLLDHPAAAREFFEKALWKNRRSPEYSYYLGVCCLQLGEEKEAEFQLERSCCSADWRPAATARLAELFFRQRRGAELEKILSMPGSEHNIELLETAALYAFTRKRDTGEIFRKIKTAAPENPLPELLQGKYDFSGNFDLRHLLITVERLFVHGLAEHARQIASHYRYQDPAAAYLCNDFELAEEASPAGIFPPPELAARLESIIHQNPGLPRGHYYCGLLRAAREDWEGALKAWKKSWQLGVRDPELCRNLGIYYWNVAQDPAKAAEYYESGFDPGKVNYKYVCEYDMLLEQLKATKTRRELFAALPQKVKDNSYVLLRMAELQYLEGDPEGALDTLKGRHFVLCEGKSMTGALFIAANHALGDRAISAGDPEKALFYYETAMSYPHDLGVGLRTGKFDMKTKYLILKTLTAMGRQEEAESRRQKWLRECAELDIEFSTLAVIRWECGVPFPSALLEENNHYWRLIDKREYEQ